MLLYWQNGFRDVVLSERVLVCCTGRTGSGMLSYRKNGLRYAVVLDELVLM